MDNELDKIKYDIINIKNDIDTKLKEIELLIRKLDYIWLKIEKINK